MKSTWNEAVISLLIKNGDSAKANQLAESYLNKFPDMYTDLIKPYQAAMDVYHFSKLDSDHTFSVEIYEESSDRASKHIRLYQVNQTIALSEILPILENFGLRTQHEETYKIRINDEKEISIIDFSVDYYKESNHSLAEISETFKQAITQVIMNGAESDGFNKLVIAANMNIDTINIVRSYSKYLKQIKYRYSQSFIENTLVSHVNLTKMLIDMFVSMHHPEHNNTTLTHDIIENIHKSLESVKNIDDDNIIRRFLLLIKATLRTNYFQVDANGQHKEYITLKIDSRAIPDLPLPKPLIDTFVYSSLFEGVHLRSHKVSRGGIRWSDRHDDYRTEVLGLMKAQKVKNSVIIPSGAKGGFVIKDKGRSLNKDLKKCIISCYQKFIRGLLDITDNIKNDAVIHPTNVVCHDGEDAYFVVAADKGTADLSDYANQISAEYSFWLGDAFASGGSNGYDHKKLGITAKGAWESLKRNLQELNRENDFFTMAGIGDMSGDVFGNGLIQSNKVKLLAAFDHRHIFLDPNPNPDLSLQERVRLFNLPTSSWNDYEKSLISTGGGVYARSEKIIKLSPEIKEALAIEENELTPDQLIRSILKAPVDVLYNGGIGTYVKSSKETSENLGDKNNEFCRVNGSDLRCKIVCEGGNLGFTQLARVEYALRGGLINTDFIDNSAGVDCSDHEVNIKILLNKVSESGQLDDAKRSKVLASMEQNVCELVLHNNYSQALLMSYSSFHAKNYFDLYHEQIRALEELTDLDRSIEYLPSDEELANRKSSNQALTKPELAVLLAYTKIYVKDEILRSELPDNAFFNSILISSFPRALSEHYSSAIKSHSLRREIIATHLSNEMINTMGISFPFRLHNETGASISEIATAYMISATVFQSNLKMRVLESLDNKVKVDLQYELMHILRVLLNMSCRWFLQRRRVKSNLNEVVDYYSSSVTTLTKLIPTLVRGTTKEYVNKIKNRFIESGIDGEIASDIAISRVLFTALNIADVASIHGFDLEKTAQLYFHLGATFNLVWFRDLIANDNRPGKRFNLARLTLRDDIDALQRRLTISIMQSDPSQTDIDLLTANWLCDNNGILNRWTYLLKEVMEGPQDDYTSLFTCVRELSTMIDGAPKIEKLAMLAYRDALTKLPNRRAITDRLESLEAKAKDHHEKFAIHIIDLDKFKEINDTYGHQTGDDVLLEVTKRLDLSIRSGDLAARQSGDEFMVIQTNVKGESDVLHMANILLNVISKTMYINDHRLKVSASIGSAIYPEHGDNSIELIANADKAMYVSKTSGRNKSVIFDEGTLAVKE